MYDGMMVRTRYFAFFPIVVALPNLENLKGRILELLVNSTLSVFDRLTCCRPFVSIQLVIFLSTVIVISLRVFKYIPDASDTSKIRLHKLRPYGRQHNDNFIND